MVGFVEVIKCDVFGFWIIIIEGYICENNDRKKGYLKNIGCIGNCYDVKCLWW